MEDIKQILGELCEIENQIDNLRRDKRLEGREFSPIWWALDAANSAITSAERTAWRMIY